MENNNIEECPEMGKHLLDKSQVELIKIILRKDDVEKKLNEELKYANLKLNSIRDTYDDHIDNMKSELKWMRILFLIATFSLFIVIWLK